MTAPLRCGAVFCVSGAHQCLPSSGLGEAADNPRAGTAKDLSGSKDLAQRREQAARAALFPAIRVLVLTRRRAESKSPDRNARS